MRAPLVSVSRQKAFRVECVFPEAGGLSQPVLLGNKLIAASRLVLLAQSVVTFLSCLGSRLRLFLVMFEIRKIRLWA